MKVIDQLQVMNSFIRGKEQAVAIKCENWFSPEQVRTLSIRATSFSFRESNHDISVPSRPACSVATLRLHYPTFVKTVQILNSNEANIAGQEHTNSAINDNLVVINLSRRN